MHLLENFSLKTGLKVSEPHVEPSFFPVVPERYITLHTEDHSSKQWDHIQNFIDLMAPLLAQKGISIIEVGYNDLPLTNVISLKNTTTLNQTAYIIQNSLLHVGVEGLFIQLAAHFDIPVVSLFSNTCAQYAGPRWGTKSRQRLIEANRKGNKPSYIADEPLKTINTIFPELVATEVCESLNIPHSFGDYEPIYAGPKSHSNCIEVIPNFEPNPQFFPQTLLNIRLDYYFNDSLLPHFANNRKISVITETPIDIRKLLAIRNNIERIFYKVDENSDIDYVKSLQSHALPLSLLGRPNGDLSLTRFNLFDWPVEDITPSSKKNLDIEVELCDNTYFKSMKKLYSKGVEYPCKSFWEMETPSEPYQKIVDTPAFWEELDHFKIYRKV